MRIVGVSDSKSLVVVSDVFSMELDDKLLSEICRIKSDGSSLLTLTSSGNTLYILSLRPQLCVMLKMNNSFIFVCLFLCCLGEFNVFTDSESTKKVIDTAGFLGQSTGLLSFPRIT